MYDNTTASSHAPQAIAEQNSDDFPASRLPL
jgi:hypothetical protein